MEELLNELFDEKNIPESNWFKFDKVGAKIAGVVEEIYDYFMVADTDDPKKAYFDLNDDECTFDEIQLVRIKFLSELAN